MSDRLQKLSPYTIVDADLVHTLLGKLDSSNVLFLKGATGTGKSTLLKILSNELIRQKKKIYYTELRKKTELDYFLSTLAANVSSSPIAQGDRYRYLEIIQKSLIKDKVTLIVDNLHEVQDFEKLVEFFLQSDLQVKLLTSGTIIPQIPPELVLELLIHNLEPLRKDQIEKFIHLLPSSAIGSTEKLSDFIFKKTGGNPSRVTKLLSSFILSDQPISLENLETQFDKGLLSLISEFFNELDSKERALLTNLALVKYDSALRRQLFLDLSIDTKKRMMSLGLVESSVTTDDLTSSCKNYILGQLTQKELVASQEELLKKLNFKEDYDSSRDKIELLNSLKLYKNSAEIFNTVSRQIYQTGDNESFIQYSDPLLKYLSLESLLYKVEILISLNSSEKALPLLEEYKDFNSKVEKEPKFLVSMAKVLTFLGKNELAHTYLKRVFESKSLEHEVEVFAYRTLASVQFEKSPQEALVSQKKALELYQIYQLQDQGLLGQIYFSMGRAYEVSGDEEEASRCFEKAITIFKKNDDKYRTLLSQYNYYAAEYMKGNVDLVISRVKEITKESHKFSIRYIEDFCNQLVSYQLTQQGAFTLAEIELQKRYQEIKDKKGILSDSEILILRKVAYNSFIRGDYQQALEVYKMIWRDTTVQKHYKYRMVFPYYIELLESKIAERLDEKAVVDVFHAFNRSQEDRGLDVPIFAMELASVSRVLIDYEKLVKTSKFKAYEKNINYTLEISFFMGLSKCLLGYPAKAKIYLESALAQANKFKYYLYEFRILAPLVMLDLEREMYLQAEQKLDRMEEIKGDINFEYDGDWIPLLKGVLFFKRNKKTQTLEEFSRFKNPISRIVQDILFPDKRTKTGALKTGVTRDYDYFNGLLRACGITVDEKIKIFEKTGEKAIDLNQYETVVRKYDLVLDRDELQVSFPKEKKKVSLKDRAILFSILEYLILNFKEPQSKEDLAVHIWHETYNPLVHDSRIYTSIKRLREFLEGYTAKKIILSQDGKYVISSNVVFLVASKKTISDRETERQNWILEYIRNNGEIDRATIERLLKISPTLAKMDLRSLVDKGQIHAQGKGKSVRYTI